MRILIVTPAPRRSRLGNRVTALRWAGLLRRLGHGVTIASEYNDQPSDVLVALHARRSYRSIDRFHRARPDKPVIVALTGTDLYNDIHHHQRAESGFNPAQKSLHIAARLIVLNAAGPSELPEQYRWKTRVIYQSATPPREQLPRRADAFEVCVLGHLRAVKDPFRAAEAVKLLPSSSRVQVTHVGAALDEAMAQRAQRETADNPRYEWVGDQRRTRAKQILSRSRLLVHTSHIEGGANAICEALACDVPVISSKISGSEGILGDCYSGYFEVDHTQQLADLLARAEADVAFYSDLQTHCRKLAHLVEPARELKAWQELLRELRP